MTISILLAQQIAQLFLMIFMGFLLKKLTKFLIIFS